MLHFLVKCRFVIVNFYLAELKGGSSDKLFVLLFLQ